MEVAACAPQNQEAVLKPSALSSEGDCGDDVGTGAYVLGEGMARDAPGLRLRGLLPVCS